MALRHGASNSSQSAERSTGLPDGSQPVFIPPALVRVESLNKPVDPWLFQMHIWAVTQHYADYEAQIRFMLQLKDGEEIDMDHVVDEVSTLFLRACGLK